MFDNMVSALVSLFKSALTILAGGTADEVRWNIPPARGSIHEIEPGDGPAWGTLSGLTAHPTDPNRLYAVTDQDFAAHSHRRNRACVGDGQSHPSDHRDWLRRLQS